MNNQRQIANTYSAVIRTLGTGGDKYRRLLDSLKKQTLQPEHIYVIMAHGYPLPPEQIGTEEFVFTDKGMWNQRIFGLEYADIHCTSEYYLVLDDDVEFGENFAKEALATMTKYDIDLLTPQFANPDGQILAPVKRISLSNICNVLLGRRIETRRPNIRTEIAVTGGYFQNTAHTADLVPNESGNFAVFFMRRDIAIRLNYNDESWLDDTKYALPDDMVFFYKAFLNGYNTMFDRSLPFVHLGEGPSTPGRKVNSAYAQGRNYIIFWHRFIFSAANSRRRRLACKAGIGYRIISNGIAYIAASLLKLDSTIARSYFKGVRDARKYIRSTAYRTKKPAILNTDK